MMAVDVQRSPARFTAAAPQALFIAPLDQDTSIRNQYEVSPDDQRFLVVAALDLDASVIVAVLDWRSLARR
jgi:hypothetical protein